MSCPVCKIPMHCEEHAPKFHVVRFHREDGCVVGVRGPSRDKYTDVVIFDQPIRKLTVVNEEVVAYMRTLPLKVERAAKRMLAAGRRLGITDGARDMLKEALQ